MKKLTGLTIILICFAITSQSQDFGYKTIDVGGEFQWYRAGYISALHLAYNFPIHHAVLLRIGYNKANRKDLGKHDDEKGGGPGFSFGYVTIFLFGLTVFSWVPEQICGIWILAGDREPVQVLQKFG